MLISGGGCSYARPNIKTLRYPLTDHVVFCSSSLTLYFNSLRAITRFSVGYYLNSKFFVLWASIALVSASVALWKSVILSSNKNRGQKGVANKPSLFANETSPYTLHTLFKLREIEKMPQIMRK